MRATTPAAVSAFPERHPRSTLALIGLLFALAYGASLVLLAKPNGQIVLGDALEHYVQLRSMVFDRDLQFLNEYAGLYRVDPSLLATSAAAKATPTGHMRNYMPVGPALLSMPVFLLVTAGVWFANLVGVAYPIDGFGRVFQATTGFSGIVAATIGSWFAYRIAREFYDARVAIWSTLAVWLGSSALYYSLVSPAYSHSSSMFAAGAFWLFWIRTRGDGTLRRYFVLGVFAGVAALMRWQDAVLLAVPALEVWWHRQNVARLCACAAGAVLSFAPQMIVWWILYGTPLTVPQGADFMRWTDPALIAVLFSDNHGLFTWTPVVALGVAGLLLVARREPLVGVSALVAFTVSWYVNACVADWWAGEAFGARRFVSCYPLFVLGTAACFDRIREPRWMRGAAAAFAAYTLLLLVQYQVFMHRLIAGVPYPRGFTDLWLTRFRVPLDLAMAWLGRGHG